MQPYPAIEQDLESLRFNDVKGQLTVLLSVTVHCMQGHWHLQVVKSLVKHSSFPTSPLPTFFLIVIPYTPYPAALSVPSTEEVMAPTQKRRTQLLT